MAEEQVHSEYSLSMGNMGERHPHMQVLTEHQLESW